MPPPPKRASARSMRKNGWGEEFLTTNPKSSLVHADLVKLFANPQAWTCLDEGEKKEILTLLPDHVHPDPDPDPDDPNAKIAPLPESFLRYDNNWRYGVRQFQVDLESGRYDPEWLRQAAQAMEERVQGKFDRFKEEQYEEFWGQKQKLASDVLAGESSRVKLGTLVQNGIVRKGDVWKYSRIFGKNGERYKVEKEVKVVDITGSTLTFAVPSGNRIFLSNTYDEPRDNNMSISQCSKDHTSNSMLETSSGIQDHFTNCMAQGSNSGLGTVSNITNQETGDEVDDSISEEQDSFMDTDQNYAGALKTTAVIPQLNDQATQAAEESLRGHDSDSMQRNRDGCKTLQAREQYVSIVDSSIVDWSEPHIPCSSVLSGAAGNETTKDILVSNIAGPGTLGNKIIEIDGRIRDPCASNGWKQFRCYRNNQDMGSLFEIRQAWFLRGK